MKKFLKILFIFGLILLGFVTFLKHPVIQTNLLNAIFSESENAQVIIDLSSKFSSKINIIVEAELPELAEKTALQITNELNKEVFNTQDIDFKKLLNTYQAHSQYLLSKSTRNLLINKDYETVKYQAFERLINPIGMSLLPLEDDPFMLFSDYLSSLAENTTEKGIINYNDKYYKITPISINKEISLAPTLANKEVKKLVSLQKKFSNGGTTVYLTGVPVHSFHAGEKSMIEINVICIISILFLLGLFHYAFKSYKLFLPAVLSLIVGIFAGVCTTGLFSNSLHILTFVFSTTLIGVCIDYSLHYFVEKSFDKLKKSMTISLISTTFAFLILFFSGVELLKQIALFTIAGLVSVYLFVLLFYPDMCKKLFSDYEKKLDFNLTQKARIMILLVVFIIMIFGVFRINFNDNIKNMYVPSKQMIYAEKLFSELTNSTGKTFFILVKGDNIENILEQEEEISQNINDYQSISKYIPSHKRQNENFALIKDFYNDSLSDYAKDILTKEQTKKLLNMKSSNDYLDVDFNSALTDFMIDDKTSIMVVSGNKEEIKADNSEIIDLPQIISDKIANHRINCMKLILPVVFGLYLLLVFAYRNCIKAFKVILPSIIAVCFSLCFAALISKEINLFHILSLFLIIGFGLDYSVFRVSGVKNSTLAIFLSCATSAFSFGLLAFTGFKLISSMGLILSVGLLSSYILSLVLIPQSEFDENKENI